MTVYRELSHMCLGVVVGVVGGSTYTHLLKINQRQKDMENIKRDGKNRCIPYKHMLGWLLSTCISLDSKILFGGDYIQII